MTVTDLQDVAWDLEPLVDGAGPDGADRLLAEADERAVAFSERYAGRVKDLDGPELAAAMADLQQIAELVGRVGSYAQLRFSVDTADPVNGALLARVHEQATSVETKLLFFDLEWAAIDDERAAELLASDGWTRAAITCRPSAATARTCSASRRSGS
jgi:oligoendopeptidase F